MAGKVKQYVQALICSDGLKFRLIRGGLGSAALQISSRGLAVVLGIVLARMLGTEGYGIYAYAFAMMSLLAVPAEAGVPVLLVREVAAYQARGEWGLLRGVVQRAMQFTSVSAIGVPVIGLMALWVFSGQLSQLMLITMVLMLLILPLSVWSNICAHVLRGMHYVVLGQTVEMLIRPLLILAIMVSVFIIWPSLKQPQYAMAVQLGVAVMACIVSLAILRSRMPVQAKLAEPVYKNREWVKNTLPFMLLGGAGIINSQIDIIMLGWFRDAEEIGLYRVATQGAALVAFGLQAVNVVAAPQFSRLFAQGDMVQLQHLVTQSARVVVFSALPAALCFIFVGEPIVKWVFGVDFAAAYVPLAILAVGQLANAGFGSVGVLLNMTGHERVVSNTLWLTALLNILLNAALMPFYGMNGAAIATAITLVVWNVLLYREVRIRIGIRSVAIV